MRANGVRLIWLAIINSIRYQEAHTIAGRRKIIRGASSGFADDIRQNLSGISASYLEVSTISKEQVLDTLCLLRPLHGNRYLLSCLDHAAGISPQPTITPESPRNNCIVDRFVHPDGNDRAPFRQWVPNQGRCSAD
jgi:hypothetical protein